jgi:DHA2 family methylenomycin A resistance protein-like MFS transporter
MGGMQRIGPGHCPTIGGLLIARFDWRSIFLVVVPVGLAALALALPTIPESSDPQHRRFDAPAQILGGLALGGLAVAAIESHGATAIAAAALAVSLLSLVLFIKVEAKSGTGALVPLVCSASARFAALSSQPPE